MASQLDKAWEAYLNQVEKIAEEQFEKVVKPFLVKKGWSFGTYNGDEVIWYHERSGKRIRRYVDVDDLPEKVRKVLHTNVPGVQSCFLSSFMPDYRHER